MPVRQNVWRLGGEWAPAILWYARGVRAMQARPLSERTSWRFYAAIHGFHAGLWSRVGYLAPTDEPPSPADRATYWSQCQHGSWYFLPWHRGYLLAFEKVVRAAIVELGGPADWALPYWNYFASGENGLPREFGSPDWPDGVGDNPLFTSHRYGPFDDGDVHVPLENVNLSAMTEHDFTGVASGGSPGFGGIDTWFSHGGQTHGSLETQPHDWVHGLVGGADPNSPPAQPPTPGLMSHPIIAGLDPIFWLHHANIDRLWEAWRRDSPQNQNPTSAKWLQGPASNGERAFVMPTHDGMAWTYTPAEMVDLSGLGYEYDDLTPGAAPAPTPLSARIARLRPSGPIIPASAAMSRKTETELVGATMQAIALEGAGAHALVHLDRDARRRVSATLSSASVATPPDRVFLNLENVRGKLDSVAFHVYVGLPSEGPLQDRNKAGSIALFGVSSASSPDDEHGGAGLTYVLEITDIVDRLHLDSALDRDSLDVRLVPVKPIPQSADVTIGRVSVVRQGTE